MGVLANKPSPDWKGGVAVAVRQWSRKAEPWKAGKNALRGIFTHKFPSETCRVFIANI